jgi:hypothetical protein
VFEVLEEGGDQQRVEVGQIQPRRCDADLVARIGQQ